MDNPYCLISSYCFEYFILIRNATSCYIIYETQRDWKYLKIISFKFYIKKKKKGKNLALMYFFLVQ